MIRRALVSLLLLVPVEAAALVITVDTVVDDGLRQILTEDILIGDGTSTPVTLTLRGTGTFLDAAGSEDDAIVGRSDAARLVVEQDARLDLRGGNLNLARNGGQAELVVDGTDSWVAVGRLFAGSDASIQVTAGGLLDIEQRLTGGALPDSSLLVSGAGSALVAGDVEFTGSVRVEDGGFIDGSVSARDGTEVVVTGAGSRTGDVTVGDQVLGPSSLIVEQGAKVLGGVSVRAGTATVRTGGRIEGGEILVLSDGPDASVLRLESGTESVVRELALRGEVGRGQLDLSDGGVLYLSGGSIVPSGIAPSTVKLASDGFLRGFELGGIITGDVESQGLISLAGSGLVPVPNGVTTLDISGDLTLQTGSELRLGIEAAGNDLIAVGGDAIVAGLLAMAVDSDLLATVLVGDVFTLIDSSSAIQGAFDNVVNGGELQFDFGAEFIRFSVHYGSGSAFDSSDLVFAVSSTSSEPPPPVPEPALFWLAGTVALRLGSTRRRR